MNANATQFKGYKTKIGGKVAFVVNENSTHLKVVFGRLIGYAGWSGGAYPQYDFGGKRVWIPK